MLALAALVGVLIGMLPNESAKAQTLPFPQIPVAAASAEVLVVAPGRIGSLRMGTATARAKETGWLSRGMCGWEPGRRALLLDTDGARDRCITDGDRTGTIFVTDSRRDGE